jgi:hypothetical protein
VPDSTAKDKSLPTLIAELWGLVRAYATQQTLEPLKGIGRYIAFGVGGSFLVGIGSVLLSVAALRALQSQTGTTFEGNWSWAPYLLTLIGCAIVIALALSATKKRGSTS